MAYDLKWADPGGEHFFSLGALSNAIAAGWLDSVSGTPPTLTSAAPAGRFTQYAYQFSSLSFIIKLLGNYQSWILGFAYYVPSTSWNTGAGVILIGLGDSVAGVNQVDVRINSSGNPFITRNGTTLVTSGNVLSIGWHFFELKAFIAGGTSGSAELRVDGTVWATISGTNTQASGNAYANQLGLENPNGSAVISAYMKDIHVLIDVGVGGTWPGYRGDQTVYLLHPTTAGVNNAWTANVGPFTLTSVNGAGVYTGTVTGGASNAYVGKTFVITGFTNPSNNIIAVCTASTATTLTFAVATTIETHSGSAAFQSSAEMVNDGINDLGSVGPDGDVTYVSSSTPGQLSDWGHEPLSGTGNITGVVHVQYARKDDANARQIAAIALSSGTQETGPTNTLGSSYKFYEDFVMTDPHTSAAWGLTALNAATFGVKEIA